MGRILLVLLLSGLTYASCSVSILSRSYQTDIVFCVVTARREISYLDPLEDALLEQDEDIMVIDTDNSTDREAMAFRLVNEPTACLPGNVPCPMQRQAMDVVRGMQRCLQEEQGLRYLALVEDDMAPCEGAVRTITDTVDRLQDFKTARFAKFSRAVVLPKGNVLLYAKYVRRHVHETQHDILLNFKWARGEDYIHPHSLFTHQELVSTIMERNDPAYMQTYADLRGETCGTPLVGK
jgi:hypothetical protein